MSFCAIALAATTNIAVEKSSFLFIILKSLKLILGGNLNLRFLLANIRYCTLPDV